MLDVTGVLRPEREALLALLAGLSGDDWRRPTECPAYDVKGVATHVLGDDVSLLSRQRDGAEPGLVAVAEELPGADFRTLLDTFNDRWVSTARFFSPAVVIELLRWSGEATAAFYCSIDLESPGEPVGFFGARGPTSPYWQAVVREYVERWVHHSQIRRAVGLPSVHDPAFLGSGAEVVAAVARWTARVDGGVTFELPDGTTLALGDAATSAALLTRAYTADEAASLLSASGPGAADALALAAAVFARPG